MDVTDEAAVRLASAQVEAHLGRERLAGLVNNAGIAPIWDKAEAEDFSGYRDTDYAKIVARFSKLFIAEGRKGFPPERIGATVLAALTAARPRVRYAVVPQRFMNWTLPMLLPKRLLDKMISKQLGMAKS